MIRKILYWIGRAIGTYNPAPLDFPQPCEREHWSEEAHRRYVRRIEGRPEILRGTVPGMDGKRLCEVCRRETCPLPKPTNCDLRACPFSD